MEAEESPLGDRTEKAVSPPSLLTLRSRRENSLFVIVNADVIQRETGL